MHGGAEVDPAELSQLVQELLEKEDFLAEQNAKRLRQVIESFSRDNAEANTNICDMLMLPLDHMINKLLQQTTMLKQLRYADAKGSPSNQDLKQQSEHIFHQWAIGAFGSEAMTDLLNKLRSWGCPSAANHLFPAYNFWCDRCLEAVLLSNTIVPPVHVSTGQLHS